MKKMLRLMATMGLMLVVAGGVAKAALISRVDAHDTDTWRVPVTAGEVVTIRVNGDSDTDLDLFVKQNGVLLGVDDDGLDYCVVRVRARRTGVLIAEVQNLGGVYNEYEFEVDRD
jgi:hypothetical protein